MTLDHPGGLPGVEFRPVYGRVLAASLKPRHFDTETHHATLTQRGRTLLVETLRDDFQRTVSHRELGRKVSYDELLYLDALALTRHCLEGETYKPFRVWW